MSNPEIPNWTFWEVLLGSFVFILDIFIVVFLIELLSGRFFRGEK